MFFHENAGNLGLRMDYLAMVYHELNCDIVVVAYRGYSHSSGVPSEYGLNLDAAAIIDYVLSSKNEMASWYSNRGGIFVVGRSLGGAVAANVISGLSSDKLNFIDGLILENTWTSLDDLVFDYFWFMAALRKLILMNHWNTLELIPKLDKVPMLHVSGSRDSITSQLHTVRLVNANSNPRFKPHVYREELGGHSDTWLVQKDVYRSKVEAFM